MPPRLLNSTRVNKQFAFIHDDCLTFEYRRVKQRSAVSAQAIYPTHHETISYFEVKILSKSSAGNISIGLAPNTMASNRLPGWDKNSFGYMSNGKKYTSNEEYNYQRNASYSIGDVIGCGYNKETQEIFFTKNGVYLGTAFRNVPQTQTYYPTIGLQSPGDKVKANFGQENFVFDFMLLKDTEYNIVNYRFETASPQLSISEDGLTIRYDQQAGPAGSAQTIHPFPRDKELGYFEVKILSKSSEGDIAIGLCWGFYPSHCLPGWNSISYAYHAEDGCKYISSGKGIPYGPTFSVGDVIGCGIHYVKEEIFFTKNGKFLGVACSQVFCKYALYPTVGLQAYGDCVSVVFDPKKFLFDPATYCNQ